MSLVPMAKKVISPQQKSLLISYLEEHPQLVKQKQGNQHTNADATKLWQELSGKLNSIPGAMKGWKEWRKTWSDLKTRTKKKVSENKKEHNKTGGGPHTGDIIDAEDDKILDIIGGDILITGLDAPEVGLPLPENKNFDISKWDYLKNTQESEENEDMVVMANKRPSTSKGPFISTVRPPVKACGTSRNRPRQATNRAAFDLVKATEATNTIREKYYARKLEIMEESLQIQKKHLEIQQRIADELERFLEIKKLE
ncbi:unnamed protein product [Ceutorhynchus assimilis]|uniref:Regulatory protein zeste n=1 Tax=Ceutorhynchus assimilis TaxID=467358 RepID=A0A9N9QHV9_9CUCU|nr:unnamed protein product [Ceutorhynchus assimilis]